MVQKEIMFSLVMSLLVAGFSTTGYCVDYSGVGVISTGLLYRQDSPATLEKTISVVNITRVDTQEQVVPMNISFEVYNYQGEYQQVTNETEVTFGRTIGEPSNCSYCLTIWGDENYGEVKFTVCENSTIKNQITITPSTTTTETKTNSLGIISLVILIPTAYSFLRFRKKREFSNSKEKK
jgi:hypothetical protein